MFRSSLANEGWHLHKCGKLHGPLWLCHTLLAAKVAATIHVSTILAAEEGPGMSLKYSRPYSTTCTPFEVWPHNYDYTSISTGLAFGCQVMS